MTDEAILTSLKLFETPIKHLYFFETCNDFNYLKRCRNRTEHSYEQIMADSQFCIIIGTSAHFTHFTALALYDALKFNCIPVIVADEWILPFSEFLDWQLFSVQLRRAELGRLMETIDQLEVEEMTNQGKVIFDRYFSSIKHITLAMFQYMQGRIYPNLALSYEEFNNKNVTNATTKQIINLIYKNCNLKDHMQKAFVIPYKSTKKSGFTAVIIGSKHIESTIYLIQNILIKCKSLNQIVLLWYGFENIQLVQNLTRHSYNNIENNSTILIHIKLMNVKRIQTIFYPFSEFSHSTESIFMMEEHSQAHPKLTPNRIEAAYDSWSRNPSLMKQFLRRFFFYHSIYNQFYYSKMATQSKHNFQTRMNFKCEIFLMNSFIANMTLGRSFFDEENSRFCN